MCGYVCMRPCSAIAQRVGWDMSEPLSSTLGGVSLNQSMLPLFPCGSPVAFHLQLLQPEGVGGLRSGSAPHVAAGRVEGREEWVGWP